jgi:deoxycytidylate deaminase
MTPDELEATARQNGIYVIGLTGPFGSGCTTAAQMLAKDEPAFTPLKLSDVLRSISSEPELDDRYALQNLGNRLRHEEGNAALVVRALGGLLKEHPDTERVVIDGIRNLGEVRWLQRALGDQFSLFAIIADTKLRFERQSGGLSSDVFYELDQRDQGESEDYGQQVNRCVDFADVLIPNNEPLATWQLESKFGQKVREYAALVEGRLHRYATPNEMLMNIAYASSYGSKCLKRQVGCVIAEDTEPLSSGYNENPDGLKPCIEQFETCYRDIVRHERFLELATSGARCPFCSTDIPKPLEQPWDCPTCGKSLDAAFFPDRAMKWCTALHAEERALINVGDRNLSSATLYTTTFPCMLCAEKIIHAGIRKVVYIEAYPDAHGVILFQEAGAETHRFEGVRSRNFERYFAGTQPEMEEAGKSKMREIAKLI